MPRYCVNAAVTSDAWVYIEADDQESAKEQASTLAATDFELGDRLYVQIDLVAQVHDA